MASTESDTEATNSIKLPAYSFYRYRRNKKAVAEDQIRNTTYGDFSLSVITSNLTTEYETDLRNFVSKRVSKGSLTADGQGSFCLFTFGENEDSNGEASTVTTDCLCYFCLLSHDRDELSNILAGGSTGSSSAEEFIICLLASQEAMLDLFRPELDVFSKKLLSILEPDLLIELDLREELGQLDGLDDRLQPVLDNWYTDCTDYLVNCVDILDEDIKYILYAALSDIKLDLRLNDKKLKSDIIRFVDCCSLSELLSSVKSDSHSDTSSCVSDNTVLVDVAGGSNKEEKLQVTLDSDGKYQFSSCDCTQFCDEWTQTLLTGDPDSPVYVKQVIDSYKLRAIQDMNNFKRLIKQAESDYYALFRVYIFLTRSGNSSMLLRHAQSEAISAGHKETLSTLSTLNKFIIAEAEGNVKPL